MGCPDSKRNGGDIPTLAEIGGNVVAVAGGVSQTFSYRRAGRRHYWRHEPYAQAE